MSTGCMTQVASIPLAPPLTNGLIAFQMVFFGAVSGGRNQLGFGLIAGHRCVFGLC